MAATVQRVFREHGPHYVFKVAISDHRIVSAEAGKVTFSYRKPKSGRTRHMTLAAPKFMRRFLQHALPTGFMKVRHYGFMHPCSGVPIEKIRASVEMTFGFDVPEEEAEAEDAPPAVPVCPDCGGVLRYLYSVLPYMMPRCRDPASD